MVNKKGYIKTLEAVIAIIMIILVSYTLIPRSIEKPPETPLVLQGSMKSINERIEFDEDLREGIVEQQSVKEELKQIIENDKPRNYDFTCVICSNNTACFPVEYPLGKNIYVSDVFIASSKEEQKPKIVRIWFWEGPTKEEELTCPANWLNKCLDTPLAQCP